MNWINYLRNVVNEKQSVKDQALAITAARKALLIHDFRDTIELIKNDSEYLNCNGPIEKVKYLREVHSFSLFEANTIYNYIRGQIGNGVVLMTFEQTGSLILGAKPQSAVGGRENG